MTFEHIADIDDPRLEAYRNLKDTNRTRWESIFIAEGEKLVERLIDSTFEVVSILLGNSFVDRWKDRLPEGPRKFVLPDRWIEDLIGFNFHRGILACGRRKDDLSLDVALPKSDRLLVVICPEINDPQNLGGIVRTAATFRADAILLGPRCCDPFSRRVLRVSMGAVLQLPILQPKSFMEEVARLRNQWDVEVVATVLDPGAEVLQRASRRPRMALAFGTEAHGLSEDFLAHCDRRVTIPMPPGVDSLNVATATGIFLYHFADNGPSREFSTRQ